MLVSVSFCTVAVPAPAWSGCSGSGLQQHMQAVQTLQRDPKPHAQPTSMPRVDDAWPLHTAHLWPVNDVVLQGQARAVGFDATASASAKGRTETPHPTHITPTRAGKNQSYTTNRPTQSTANQPTHTKSVVHMLVNPARAQDATNHALRI